MLAIYGKGGIGKSFFTANLSAKMALKGLRVLQLGCDPKHDSCNALFEGRSLPTIGDQWRLFKDAGREKELDVRHLIFKADLGRGAQLFGAELGGPEVGRGCGGRGISFGFGLLEERGMANWALDYIIMDFLGDVVCGGFATPIAKSLAEEIIIVASHDRMSLYAANNIARAVNYFQAMGGSTRLIGMVLNRDDGSGVAERFAERIGLPILAKIPFSPAARALSDRCKLLFELPEMDAIFDAFVNKIHRREYTAPTKITPLEYDEFLAVFGASEPPDLPQGATLDELMGRDSQSVVGIDLNSPDYSQDSKVLVRRIMQEMGLKVTRLVEEPERGVVVTTEAGWEAVFGDPCKDIDAKIAILSALGHSGEKFRLADLRYTAAPFYE
ncbi:MAG: chlorophyllide a reductase iron protein subunit X [Chloroflexi bacterium]|jgi:chlorophyllide a reductase subunit X|uniref:nitrogenase n=1 Tax=Candidatus Thermofonsia Clade 3 bacterium TaxID=2364212 RepID=A0A2M8QG79_9CHLR|nr:chlorophyllide a reductase iron protein subunit X [Candidatus Roseilinea sp. NK_OTU-006]PJF48825.1 MAG: chlorophyllide a reductase iron protein subunit X [Candidatus Thermofonsia Clade 3 bacterium]RMG64427.1 MAG: chlorophyllide a reductase iron protein subunit X [Chloroflexota bacterium]